MTPILFDKTETEFKTQGLGALTDAISCTVTEERNGSFELEMAYPLGGLHYEDIQYGRIILAVPSDGAESEPFEIYKITRPLGGKVTIYAQHVSYRLSYTATLPSGNLYQSAVEALQSLKDNAASTCPFTFSSDVTKAGQFQSMKVQSIRSLLGGQDGSVLDVFGGEYQWNRWNVNLLSARGSEQPIILEYGKNITDLKQEENITSTYTAVIAMWTQSNDESGTSTVYSDLVKTANADSYPYLRTTIVDVSSEYDSAPTRAQLTSRAQTYINSNNLGVPKVSVTVSFVNLRDTAEYKDIAPLQTVHLCDTIKVRFPALGVDATAKVITTEWDVLNERYDSIEVGDSKSSLADTILDGDTEALKQTDVKFEIAQNGIYAEVKRAQGAEGTLSSKISQNAEAITTKVTQEEVESTIEQKADSIRLKADKISWSSDNSSMTEDGHLTCQNATVGGKVTASSGSVGGFTIVDGSLRCDRTSKSDWGGNGIYVGPDGLAIGQANDWNGQPVLRVDANLKSGDVQATKVCALAFYREDQSMDGTSGGIIWADTQPLDGKGIKIDGSCEATAFFADGERITSDRRLKDGIETIPAAESLQIITGLRPVSYTHKRLRDGKRHRGFIAQEVEQIVPENCGIVGTKGDEELGERHLLSYIEIIADLVNVIQNQEKRIAALEEKVNGKC